VKSACMANRGHGCTHALVKGAKQILSNSTTERFAGLLKKIHHPRPKHCMLRLCIQLRQATLSSSRSWRPAYQMQRWVGKASKVDAELICILRISPEASCHCKRGDGRDQTLKKYAHAYKQIVLE